jgi:hypothetical protein
MEKMYSEIALLIRKYPLRRMATSMIIFPLYSHIASTRSSWKACSNADFVSTTQQYEGRDPYSEAHPQRNQ